MLIFMPPRMCNMCNNDVLGGSLLKKCVFLSQGSNFCFYDDLRCFEDKMWEKKNIPFCDFMRMKTHCDSKNEKVCVNMMQTLI